MKFQKTSICTGTRLWPQFRVVRLYTFRKINFQKDLTVIPCKLSPHKQEAVLDTFFIDKTYTKTDYWVIKILNPTLYFKMIQFVWFSWCNKRVILEIWEREGGGVRKIWWLTKNRHLICFLLSYKMSWHDKW